MTTVTITRTIDTGINFIVEVRTVSGNPVIFYGFNDAKITSITPMPDGRYIIEGETERPPFARPTVAEIVTAFDGMAVELPEKISEI